MSGYLAPEALAAISSVGLQAEGGALARMQDMEQLQWVRNGASEASALAAAPGKSAFGSLIVEGIEKVNSQLLGSQVDLQHLALGDAQNLHQIMINLEESSLGFQLMMQVRGRLLEAYQDVMKMSI
jgi:flagellar hook-basal body complex protein FliE